MAALEGSCHCGGVRFALEEEPKWLTSCNCSVCRRLAALWCHVNPAGVRVAAVDDATINYVQGEKTLAIHTCRTCGCTTHYTSLDPDKHARMAVNVRMCPEVCIEHIRVRHFDGADSWEYLD